MASSPTKSSLVLTVVTGGSIVLSFVAQVVIAYLFGAGTEIDSYFVATAIPTFVALLVNDAVGLAILPLMNQLKIERGDAVLADFRRATLGLLVAAAAGGAVLCVVASGPIIGILAPSLEPRQHALAAQLFSILMVSAGLSMIASTLLYFKYFDNVFVVPSFVHFIPPSLIAIFGLLFAKEWGVKSLAVGALAGSASQCVVLLAASAGTLLAPRSAHGDRTRPLQALRNVPLEVCSLLPVPAVPVIDRYLASALPAGSISHLAYSWTIALALASLVSRGAMVRLFPYFAEKAHTDVAQLRATLSDGVGVFLFVGVPTVAILTVTRAQIVQLVLMRGRFTAADAQVVSSLLLWHGLAVLGIVMYMFLTRANYALRMFSLTATTGVALVVGYGTLSLTLVRYFGVTGIAMANAAVWVGMALVLALILRQRGILNASGRAANLAARVVGAAVAVVIGLELAQHLLRLGGGIASLAVALAAGTAGYVVLGAYVFRVPLARTLMTRLTSALLLRD